MVHRYLQTTLLLNLPVGVTNPCYLANVVYDISGLVFVDTLGTAAPPPAHASLVIDV